jgi:hypothetical protein
MAPPAPSPRRDSRAAGDPSDPPRPRARR